MKIFRTVLVLLPIVIMLAACSPLRAEEAIDRFKKALEENIKGIMNAGLNDESAAAKVTLLRESQLKIKAAKTDGLPADLKVVADELIGAFGKLGDVLKEFPEKPDDIAAFVRKKENDGSDFFEKFTTRMNVVGEEVGALSLKFAQVGAKYGMTPLFSEEAALIVFRKQLIELEPFGKVRDRWALKYSRQTAGIVAMREVSAAFQAVETDGLPDEWKVSYDKFAAVMGRLRDELKVLPATPEEIDAFIQKKASEGPAFMAEFGRKMESFRGELDAHAVKLKGFGVRNITELLHWEK